MDDSGNIENNNAPDQYEKLLEQIRSTDTRNAISDLFVASDSELSSSYKPGVTERS